MADNFVVSIAFAASVPFIFLAFYQDKITSWFSSSMKEAAEYVASSAAQAARYVTSCTKNVAGYVPWWLKTPLTILLLIGASLVLVATLTLIWTRPLASAAKVAVTIALVLLIVVASVCLAIYDLKFNARPRLGESSDGESGSSLSLVDD